MCGKFLAITAIILVVVVMGIGAVAPAIPTAEGFHNTGHRTGCEKLEEAIENLTREAQERILTAAGCL